MPKKCIGPADETGHIVLPLNVSTASHFCYAHIAGQNFWCFFLLSFAAYWRAVYDLGAEMHNDARGLECAALFF